MKYTYYTYTVCDAETLIRISNRLKYLEKEATERKTAEDVTLYSIVSIVLLNKTIQIFV